jgi:oligoendopeptidase F
MRFNPPCAPDTAIHPLDPARGYHAGAALPSWDLRDLYAGPDDPAINDDFSHLAAAARQFRADLQGQLAVLSAAAIGQAIDRYQTIETGLARLHAYAQLRFSADQTAPGVGSFMQTIAERVTAIGRDLVFFALELTRLDDAALDASLTDPALARWAPFLTDLRSFRPHLLDDDLEKLLHDKDVTGHAAWARLFDEVMARLRIHIGGSELTLTAALDRLSDPDRAMRGIAARAIGAALEREAPVLALILNTIAKDKETNDRWRRYPTPIAARNRANRVEDSVITALTEAVQSAYPTLSHRYYRLKARWLGYPTLAHWDRNAPLPGDHTRPIPWAEATALVQDAYRQFSPEMGAIAEQFFTQPWIDAAPRVGKSAGAFAHPTVPGAHPYIALNYQGRPRDVMTLAHELGHGIHQALAAPHGHLMATTPLTLAETASMFGEKLVFNALLAAESDPQRRFLLRARKVEDMLNTVVRQIAFLQFEQRVHAERAAGELSIARINTIWLDVQRASLGPAFEFSEDFRLFWAYVPHMVHTPFYVYAYAFGDCLVNTLIELYREACTCGRTDHFRGAYLNLLRAGGTRPYRQLLEPLGVDPADPAFWQRGLGLIAAMIDELEG